VQGGGEPLLFGGGGCARDLLDADPERGAEFLRALCAAVRDEARALRTQQEVQPSPKYLGLCLPRRQEVQEGEYDEVLVAVGDVQFAGLGHPAVEVGATCAGELEDLARWSTRAGFWPACHELVL